ncbi:MAG: PulJ/GspJ family protein, partial [Planctomycetia bacterium]
MRTNINARRRGLTLVEMLVAVSLSLLMFVLFTTLFVSGSDAVRMSRGMAEVDQKMRGFMTLLRNDLQHVDVGNDGRYLTSPSPGDLFRGLYGEPPHGYFLIEENIPACPLALTPQLNDGTMGYRQGIDIHGRPAEIDTDDVLAFTASLQGGSSQEVFYGRVPIDGGGVTRLDDYKATTRFDKFGNGVFTSSHAEIVYFLRPSRRQYNLQNDINNPGVSTQSPSDIPAQPALYTLYRRVLLVCDGQTATYLNDPLIFPTGVNWQNYYRDYDVSATWNPTTNRM